MSIQVGQSGVPSHIFTATDSSGSGEISYQPRFQREHWGPQSRAADVFFDQFVPAQYAEGFGWRCQCLGGEELARFKSFEEQPERIKTIIAHNAELLLELLCSYPPEKLDEIRSAGKKLIEEGLVSVGAEYDFDLQDIREEMGIKHHAKWLAKFKQDVQDGKREANHRGIAERFEDLPKIEQDIIHLQTWANWRVLASLSETDYALVRQVAEKNNK